MGFPSTTDSALQSVCETAQENVNVLFSLAFEFHINLFTAGADGHGITSAHLPANASHFLLTPIPSAGNGKQTRLNYH